MNFIIHFITSKHQYSEVVVAVAAEAAVAVMVIQVYLFSSNTQLMGDPNLEALAAEDTTYYHNTQVIMVARKVTDGTIQVLKDIEETFKAAVKVPVAGVAPSYLQVDVVHDMVDKEAAPFAYRHLDYILAAQRVTGVSNSTVVVLEAEEVAAAIHSYMG